MKKLLVISLSAVVAAVAFAPAAQAKHRRKVVAAPAPIVAPAVNPRVNAQGEFYATPVGGMSPLGLIAGPLAVPGAVAGGAADLGLGAGLGAADLGLGAAGAGLDVITAPLK